MFMAVVGQLLTGRLLTGQLLTGRFLTRTIPHTGFLTGQLLTIGSHIDCFGTT